MIELLSLLKLLSTLGVGASLGAAVSGGLYLAFTRRADSTFYAVMLLGATTGTGIHGLVRYFLGPRQKHRRLERDVLDVKAFRDTGFLDRQEAQGIINNLVETSYLGERRSDSKRKAR